jgi:hypothetical protein
MVTISITPAAFAAIKATLPKESHAETRPDGRGGYLITLPHGVLNRLKAMRGPRESYTDRSSALRAWARGYQNISAFVSIVIKLPQPQDATSRLDGRIPHETP